MRVQRLPMLLIGLFFVMPAFAQQGDAVVRFAEVETRELRASVELPGTVRSVATSLVASEVAGLVERLPAREGARVQRGEPLAHLRRKPLELRHEAAIAEREEAEARQRQAERRLERAQELHQEEVLSQQELDDALAEFEAWGARVERLRSEIARIEEDLERSLVPAPFGGVVTREHVELGEWVGVGDTIVELTSLEHLEIVVDLPERHYPHVKVGDEAQVRLEALSGEPVSGRIAAIIPAADPESRTFPVKVRIDNEGERIGVGMLARVSLPLGSASEATVVPKDAVVRSGGPTRVYLIADDDTVVERRVETGRGEAAWVEIRGEVSPGERVVVRGNERLRAGQKVQALPFGPEATQ